MHRFGYVEELLNRKCSGLIGDDLGSTNLHLVFGSRSTMNYRRVLICISFAALFAWTSSVGVSESFAQGSEPKTVVPTSAQLELNDAGVQAIIAEDYELAVKLFDSSLALGPINITFVNRGRALQHAGKCERAEESYEAAYSAPTMTEPSAANVAATIERYRAELREECPGKVLLECDPVTLQVSIDGESLGSCPQEPIELSKGEHHIRGTSMGKSVETVVDIAPLKLRRLTLKLDADTLTASGIQAADSSDGVRPLVVEESVAVGSGSSSTGYWLLGTSAAILAGGIVMDNVPATSRNRSYDHVDVVPVTMYVGGALLAIYGISSLMN